MNDQHALFSDTLNQRMLLELIAHAELVADGIVSEEVAALKAEIQERVVEGQRRLPWNALQEVEKWKTELLRALMFTWDLPIERHAENSHKIKEYNAQLLLWLAQLDSHNLEDGWAYTALRNKVTYASRCLVMTNAILVAKIQMKEEEGRIDSVDDMIQLSEWVFTPSEERRRSPSDTPAPTRAFYATMLPKICKTEMTGPEYVVKC